MVAGTLARAHGRALREDPRDVGVEADQHVLLILDLGVALVDLAVHPVLERLADDGVDDVAEVGPGELLDLLRDGQMLQHLRVLLGEVQHRLHLEALVLRDVDHPHVLALDELLLAARDVSQVPVK